VIVTVTLNSTVDRVIYIDSFRPGEVMRTTEMVTSVGGKGFDASVALRTFNEETVGIGFVAGHLGQELQRLLEAYGIQPELIWVDGETRLSNVIVEKDFQRHSHIIVGALSVTPAHMQQLREKVEFWSQKTGWVVLGGSIPGSVPVDVYALGNGCVQGKGAKSLVDSSGKAVQALLKNPPDILKMNWAEFNQTFEAGAGGFDKLVAAASDVKLEKNLKNLVITCGKEGILGLTEQGDYLATSPAQQVVNAAGAGDAVSAALAHCLERGDEWAEALKWAAATGSAVVLTPGTADCYMEDIERLYRQTAVKGV